MQSFPSSITEMVILDVTDSSRVDEWDTIHDNDTNFITQCGMINSTDDDELLNLSDDMFGSDYSAEICDSTPSSGYSCSPVPPELLAYLPETSYPYVFGSPETGLECDQMQPSGGMKFSGHGLTVKMDLLSPAGTSSGDVCEALPFDNPYAKPRMTFRKSDSSSVRPRGPSHQSTTTISPGAAQQQAASRPRPRGPTAGKQYKVCCYDMCPSPQQSNKWRTVTGGTAAGGQDWQSLIGKTLCDSCYSTFRKHGTLVRSVRTPEGWARLDNEGTTTANQTKIASRKRGAQSVSDSNKKKKLAAATLQVTPPQLGAEDSTAQSDSDAGRQVRDRKPSIRLRDSMGVSAASTATNSPVTEQRTTMSLTDEHSWPESTDVSEEVGSGVDMKKDCGPQIFKDHGDQSVQHIVVF